MPAGALGASLGASLGAYVRSAVRLGAWKPTSRVFVSLLTDPYINLSLEHHIFKTTPPEWPKLMLYVNNPCVVIGRNQNPWRECNLPMMNQLGIPLVRRRSGGGAVVHDSGNVNFCVMTPRQDFTRDKHALMIVNALNAIDETVYPAMVSDTSPEDMEAVREMEYVNIGAPFAPGPQLDSEAIIHGLPLKGPTVKLKVNSRFDIVTDDLERKVSGSAYKIERLRAYHHGTMLLDSRLDTLGALLHRDVSRLGTVEGRGVASVKSPVANVGCDRDVFLASVIQSFHHLYPDTAHEPVGVIDSAEVLPAQVLEAADKLRTWDWLFGQTPEFTHKIADVDSDDVLEFTVNNGLVTRVHGSTVQIPPGTRYVGADLAPYLAQFPWILQAIDGFESTKLPGV